MQSRTRKMKTKPTNTAAKQTKTAPDLLPSSLPYNLIWRNKSDTLWDLETGEEGKSNTSAIGNCRQQQANTAGFNHIHPHIRLGTAHLHQTPKLPRP
ncbi:hypothetical protein LOK49_LG01G00839 [Camellia lanceoleosa]|uniref:Uncharacterized protein n=1 Tax=Camellia lanceoleosa TaxID=1840588 RepID=A0ACC0J2T7_9ERIC|nr:hypothetical protein LOK49_LG01G00839 [Camellia lanceoleosa]